MGGLVGEGREDDGSGEDKEGKKEERARWKELWGLF